MRCERCHKKEASVFYKETINGKTHSLSVCADCANEQNGLLFGSLFGYTETEKTCPLCHATFRSFSKDGKVGCPECYRTFSRELESTIRSIHGNVRHIGRQKQDELNSLKAQLKTAIEEENFELAATLRDQINGRRK